MARCIDYAHPAVTIHVLDRDIVVNESWTSLIIDAKPTKQNIDLLISQGYKVKPVRMYIGSEHETTMLDVSWAPGTTCDHESRTCRPTHPSS